jgi:hypothetical protein
LLTHLSNIQAASCQQQQQQQQMQQQPFHNALLPCCDLHRMTKENYDPNIFSGRSRKFFGL